MIRMNFRSGMQKTRGYVVRKSWNNTKYLFPIQATVNSITSTPQMWNGLWTMMGFSRGWWILPDSGTMEHFPQFLQNFVAYQCMVFHHSQQDSVWWNFSPEKWAEKTPPWACGMIELLRVLGITANFQRVWVPGLQYRVWLIIDNFRDSNTTTWAFLCSSGRVLL